MSTASVPGSPKAVLRTQVGLHPPSGQPHLHELSVPVASHKANTEWAFTDLAKGSPVPWGLWELHSHETEELQEMAEMLSPTGTAQRKEYTQHPPQEAYGRPTTGQPIPTDFLSESRVLLSAGRVLTRLSHSGP